MTRTTSAASSAEGQAFQKGCGGKLKGKTESVNYIQISAGLEWQGEEFEIDSMNMKSIKDF